MVCRVMPRCKIVNKDAGSADVRSAAGSTGGTETPAHPATHGEIA